MKSFSISGPVVPDEHYCIPPLARVDLALWCKLVRGKKYFVVHAPRQTGKTSALLAFRDHLNAGAAGVEYRCVYANVEGAQAAREDVASVMQTILGRLASEARETLGDRFLLEHRAEILEQFGPYDALQEALMQWAKADPRPLVLLLDEVDALVGDGLMSVLRQLRAGYEKRPKLFPQSVVLCGLRDVSDYRVQFPDGKKQPGGGSAFNIVDRSLRLGDFSPAEIDALLGQHTAESGQAYAPEAVESIQEYTQGQPWLVNALAAEMCEQREKGDGAEGEVLVQEVLAAKEALILRRDTHLDQLAERLREDRVRRVIEPMLTGASAYTTKVSDEDLQYVQDLGLTALGDPWTIANPIYKQVIPRALTYAMQMEFAKIQINCVDADGNLNVHELLSGFQDYFRENSGHWPELQSYSEAGAQLMLQAFIAGVTGKRGRVSREYDLNRRRADLLIFWRSGEAETRFVIEYKLRQNGLERTEREGLEQTATYMDISAAAEGHLVIFDRTQERSWEEKIYHHEKEHAGKTIGVWGV